MAPLSGSFEKGMEQVTQGVKKSTKQQAQAVGQAVKTQIVPQKTDVGTAGEGAAGGQQSGSSSSDQTRAVEQAASDTAAQQRRASGQKQPSPFYQRQIAKGKTPKDAANLDKIRDELHKQYFEQLTNRPKQQEAESNSVEQKKQEMTQLEEKEKNKLPPLPVVRKQRRIESLPGSG